LQPLLSQLEAEGFAISMDTLLRIEQILLATGNKYRANPEGLKEILCPIIANSEPEQVKFNRLFDYYLQQIKASDILPELPLPPVPVKRSRLGPKFLFILLGIVLAAFLLASGFSFWLANNDQTEILPPKEIIRPLPEAPCVPDQKPPAYFKASTNTIQAGQQITFLNQTTTSRNTTFIWNFGDGQSAQTNADTVSHVFMRSGVLPVSLTAFYPDEVQYCDSTYRVNVTISASDQKIALPQMFPHPDYELTIYQFNWIKFLSILGVALVLLLLFLLASDWYTQLRAMAKQIADNQLSEYLRRQQAKNAKGGNIAPFNISFPSQEANIEAVQEVYEVANAMRQRQSSDAVKLNMVQTIRKTIQAGGIVTLCYDQQSQSTEYLALIDHTCRNDHRARFFENWIDTLSLENVLIEKFFFRQDPRICWNNAHPDGIAIEELARLYPKHRLVVLDDGDYLLNPLRPQLKDWVLAAFETWNRRALVTPAEPEHWMYRERLLSNVFVVLPANLQGQAQLAELLSSDEATDFKKLHTRFMRSQRHAPMPVHSAENPDVDWTALKQYLTIPDQNGYPDEGLYTLLCALVCFDPITWEITLAIAKALKDNGIISGQTATHNSLLLLTRLPWLQQAYMPPSVRQYLLDELRQMPQAELVARKAAIELLDSIDLKEDSFARRKKEQFLQQQLTEAGNALQFAETEIESREKEQMRLKVKGNTQQQEQYEQQKMPDAKPRMENPQLLELLKQWFTVRQQPASEEAAPDVEQEYARQLRNKSLWKKSINSAFSIWLKQLPYYIPATLLVMVLGLPAFVIVSIYMLYLAITKQTQKMDLPAGILAATIPGLLLWIYGLFAWAGYTDGNLLKSETENRSAVLVNQGVDAFYANDLQKAAANFALALNLKPNNYYAQYNLAITHYAQAVKMYGNDDYTLAIKTFKQAAAEVDTSELRYNVWHNLGVCYQLLNNAGMLLQENATAQLTNPALAYYDSLNNANPGYLQRFAPNLSVLLGKKQMLEFDFPPRRLPAETPSVTAYAISKSGQYLFTGHKQGHCRTWHLPSLTLLESFETSIGNITCMDFSYNSALKAVGGEGGFIGWYMGDYELIKVDDKGPVTQLQFTPDGQQIAANFKNGTLQFYNLATQQPNPKLAFTPVSEQQNAFAMSPSGNLLAFIRSGNRLIELWQTEQEIKLAEIVPDGAFDSFTALAFSPDGKLLAATTESGRLTLYRTSGNFEKVKQTELKEQFTGSIGFSADAQTLIGLLGYTPSLWSAASLDRGFSFQPDNQLLDASFSPNGQYIVLHSADSNQLRLYQTAIYKNVVPIEPPNPADYLYIYGVVTDVSGNAVADLGIAEKSNTESMETVTLENGYFRFEYPKEYFRAGQTIELELRYPPQWVLVSPKPFKVKLAEQPQNPPIQVKVRNRNERTIETGQQGNSGNITNPNTESESRLIGSLRESNKFEQVANRFSDGLLLVYNGGKWFYLNRTGNPAFPGQYYDQANEFTNGTAKVTVNNQTYYIDKAGKCVRNCPPVNPCANIYCGAHGACNPQTGKCECKDGYTGNRCQNPPQTGVEQTVPNPCAGIVCGAHGRCNRQTGQCDCDEGYYGDRCQYKTGK